jgi:hypothetical protein
LKLRAVTKPTAAADPEGEALVAAGFGVAVDIARWISAAQRTTSTTSKILPAVASGLDDPLTMLGGLGVDQFAPMRLQPRERAFSVDAHQAATPGPSAARMATSLRSTLSVAKAALPTAWAE